VVKIGFGEVIAMTVTSTEFTTGHSQEPAQGHPLRIAFADYDRTRPLLHGLVKAEGISFEAEAKWVGDFCHRPVYEEYDAAEMSLSWYVAARERGEPCVAIPVFPLRDPLLAYVYARTDSPITKPADLIGKRIGVHGYRYTINAWLRGVFSDHYGLKPEQATWVTCEPEGAGYVAPKNIRIELQLAKNAAQLLRDGDVDALFAPRVPREFQNREGWIRRLFPDCRAENHRLVKRLGFIPVSHVIVMNEHLAKREPWIAVNLTKAFVEAQRYADEIWRTEKMPSFVDSMFHLEDQREHYGDDPFENGLGPANRANIATFTRYAREQGYISRELSIEELFFEATLRL
jgi:4,5-dihydroxyphthalate decarboxylase